MTIHLYADSSLAQAKEALVLLGQEVGKNAKPNVLAMSAQQLLDICSAITDYIEIRALAEDAKPTIVLHPGKAPTPRAQSWLMRPRKFRRTPS